MKRLAEGNFKRMGRHCELIAALPVMYTGPAKRGFR
jgi:hypothetical protein